MKHDIVTMGGVTACGTCGKTWRGDEAAADDCPGASTVESVQAKLDAGARVYTRDDLRDFLVSVRDHTGSKVNATNLFHPHRYFTEIPEDEIQNIMLKAIKAYPDLATAYLEGKPVTTGLKMDESPLPRAIDVTNIDGPAAITGDDEPPEHVKQSRAWALECNRSSVEHHPYHDTGIHTALYWFKRGWGAKGNAI